MPRMHNHIVNDISLTIKPDKKNSMNTESQMTSEHITEKNNYHQTVVCFLHNPSLLSYNSDACKELNESQLRH